MSRYREKSSGPEYGVATYSLDKGYGPVETEYVTLLQEQNEVMTDEVSNHFQSASNDGEIVINPCSHVKTSTSTIGNGFYHWIRTGGRIYKEFGPGLTDMQIQRYPTYMHGIPAEPEPSYDMVEAAKLQAFGNLDRSPYGFAEDIAEMRETLNFLRDPLKSFHKISELMRAKAEWRMLRKSNILSWFDVMSDVWLEYQFAAAPLGRSIHDLFKSIMENDAHRPKRRLARGGSEWTDKASNAGVIVTWRSSASIDVTRKVSAGIWYEHSNPLMDWRYKYGLRFKDIPETAWAIVPLSFMVDRVFDWSKTMRGLSSFLDPSVEILGAWSSESKTVTTARTWEGHVSPIVETVVQADLDTILVETDTYTRNVWEPSLGDLLPEVRTDRLLDTSTKIADLATLLWSGFRNR